MPAKFTSYFIFAFSILIIKSAFSQRVHNPIKWEIDEDRYFKFMSFVQVWARVNHNNPGSMVNNEIEDHTFDISLRRYRLKFDGQPDKRMYVALQIGGNNTNYLSGRGVSIGILDAYAEFRPWKEFHVGFGKQAWDGLSRYTSPATGAALMYDIPMVALSTINITDDLLRNLGFYFKGQISKLDYRFMWAKPLNVADASGIPPPSENVSQFAVNRSERKLGGYVKWMFFDKESNNTPFSAGTYYGDKKVFNVGAGFKNQDNALWHLSEGDTILSHLNQLGVDVFLDMPLNQEKNNVITFYAAYYNYRMGPNYIRNIGPNNPIPELNQSQASFNGRGNAFPSIGTGSTVYAQGGYLFPYFKNKMAGQLQIVGDIQWSDFEYLRTPMILYNIGVNWIIHKHFSKWSLNFQNRPIYYQREQGVFKEDSRWMIVLQYQFKV